MARDGDRREVPLLIVYPFVPFWFSNCVQVLPFLKKKNIIFVKIQFLKRQCTQKAWTIIGTQ